MPGEKGLPSPVVAEGAAREQVEVLEESTVPAVRYQCWFWSLECSSYVALDL